MKVMRVPSKVNAQLLVPCNPGELVGMNGGRGDGRCRRTYEEAEALVAVDKSLVFLDVYNNLALANGLMDAAINARHGVVFEEKHLVVLRGRWRFHRILDDYIRRIYVYQVEGYITLVEKLAVQVWDESEILCGLKDASGRKPAPKKEGLFAMFG